MKQIYKVFLNDRRIEIVPSVERDDKTVVNFDSGCSEEDISDWFFHSFINNGLKKISLVHKAPSHFFRLFKSLFLNVDAAGGAVISGKYLLVIFRKGKWDLPKGKIERGEDPEQAALREVSEEAGIYDQKILNPLPSTYHIYPSPYPETKGKWIFKETWWFKMSYPGDRDSVRPQEQEGITEVRWISGPEFPQILNNTYENLKQIIGLFAVSGPE
jgi:8-oxo-dGTP pyrophosphatase MutT (NUDIX family)